MKKMTKILAYVLAVTLVVTTFGGNTSTARVFAEETAKELGSDLFEPIPSDETDTDVEADTDDDEDAVTDADADNDEDADNDSESDADADVKEDAGDESDADGQKSEDADAVSGDSDESAAGESSAIADENATEATDGDSAVENQNANEESSEDNEADEASESDSTETDVTVSDDNEDNADAASTEENSETVSDETKEDTEAVTDETDDAASEAATEVAPEEEETEEETLDTEEDEVDEDASDSDSSVKKKEKKEKAEKEEKEKEKKVEKTEAVDESVNMGEVDIVLHADAGVLPNDAYLEVNKVSSTKESAIKDMIDGELGEDTTVEETFSYDINIRSKSSETEDNPKGYVQPDGDVEIKFLDVRGADSEDVSLAVYHVEDDLSDATPMGTEGEEATDISIDTDHFSIYTVVLVEKNKIQLDINFLNFIKLHPEVEVDFGFGLKLNAVSRDDNNVETSIGDGGEVTVDFDNDMTKIWFVSISDYEFAAPVEKVSASLGISDEYRFDHAEYKGKKFVDFYRNFFTSIKAFTNGKILSSVVELRDENGKVICDNAEGASAEDIKFVFVKNNTEVTRTNVTYISKFFTNGIKDTETTSGIVELEGTELSYEEAVKHFPATANEGYALDCLYTDANLVNGFHEDSDSIKASEDNTIAVYAKYTRTKNYVVKIIDRYMDLSSSSPRDVERPAVQPENGVVKCSAKNLSKNNYNYDGAKVIFGDEDEAEAFEDKGKDIEINLNAAKNDAKIIFTYSQNERENLAFFILGKQKNLSDENKAGPQPDEDYLPKYDGSKKWPGTAQNIETITSDMVPAGTEFLTSTTMDSSIDVYRSIMNWDTGLSSNSIGWSYGENTKSSIDQKVTEVFGDEFNESDVIWYVYKRQGDGSHIDGYVAANVTYDGNGGANINGTTVVSDKKVRYGDSVKIRYNSNDIGFIRDGYRFLGWSTEPASTTPDGQYKEGNEIVSLESKLKLYAVWEKSEFIAYWQVETYYQDEDGKFGKAVVDTEKYPVEVKFSSADYDNKKNVEVPAAERETTTTKDDVEYYLGTDLCTFQGVLPESGNTKTNPVVLKVYYLRKSLGDQLVVKAQSNTKRYDATPIDNGELPAILTLNDKEMTGDASDPYELVDVSFDGEITNVNDNGKGMNKITSYVIREKSTGKLYGWGSKASGSNVIEVKDGKVADGETLKFVSVVNGDLTIIPRTVTLTPENAEKTYDGQIYTLEQYSKDGHTIHYADQYALTDGISYEFDNEVAIKNIKGVVESAPDGEITIGKYNVYIKVNDNLIKTNEDNVIVVTETADLKINPRDVKLKSDSLEKYFDGKALVNGDTPLVTEEGWVSGEGATKIFTGTQTYPGESDNSFYIVPNKNLLGAATTDFTNYRFVDSDNKEILGYYTAEDKSIHKRYGEFGTLTVKSRDPEDKPKLYIKVDVDQSGDNEITLPYNGMTQNVDVDITVTHELTVVNDNTPVKTTTSKTDSVTGESSEQSINIIPSGSEKQSLLDKILSFGTIKAYAKDVDEVTVEYGDLTFVINGIKLKGGSGIDVGDYYMTIDLSSFKVTMKGSTIDISKEFDVEVVVPDAVKNNNDGEVVGILHIVPVKYSVSTGSASKVYDGTALTNSEAKITGLVHGETASITATGSRTAVGSSMNPYKITWNGTAKKKNYVLDKENLGTLTITPESNPDNPDNPDTPDTPDDPDTPNTPDTPDIPDNPDTPDNPVTPGGPVNPGDTPQVLGATRQLLGSLLGDDGPAVLGARRGGTDDETNTLGRIITIIVAAGIGFAMIFMKRKKKDEK